ncbi:YbaN family protein [uncultured Acinetobacter sp.]|uniref:YbaN family protein n=1 Tax=uncultured Acinetobacter sp. TaxID=165433 RepID=UPI002588B939|nr:YbaN family protein [uncultured Acinetobacter sp.]
MKTLFWRTLVVIFIILGIIGAILPGMPTTVFLILAAWAASKGWPEMDAWLLNHPKYGPTLRDWRAHGTVPRKAKWIASIMMLISGILMLFTNAPLWVKIFTDSIILIVAIWLWLRPEPTSAALNSKVHSPSTENDHV